MRFTGYYMSITNINLKFADKAEQGDDIIFKLNDTVGYEKSITSSQFY